MDDFGDEEDPILRQFQRELRQSSKAFVHRRPPSKRDQRLLKRLEAQPEFAVVCPEGNRCLVKLLNNPAATKLYFDIDGCRAICGGKELVKLRSLTAAGALSLRSSFRSSSNLLLVDEADFSEPAPAETTRLKKISATMILGALGWAVGGAFVPITGPAVAGKVIGIIVGSGGLSSGALIAKVRRDGTLTRLMEETRRVRKETLRREAMEGTLSFNFFTFPLRTNFFYHPAVRRMEAQQPADDPELLYRGACSSLSELFRQNEPLCFDARLTDLRTVQMELLHHLTTTTADATTTTAETTTSTAARTTVRLLSLTSV